MPKFDSRLVLLHLTKRKVSKDIKDAMLSLDRVHFQGVRLMVISTAAPIPAAVTQKNVMFKV